MGGGAGKNERQDWMKETGLKQNPSLQNYLKLCDFCKGLIAWTGGVF